MSHEHWAVKHPTHLEFEEAGFLSGDLLLTAADTSGARLSIVASRERWRQLLTEVGPRRSQSATVRGMYERGEVDIDAFEAALERELR